jgi:hypothetical protein
MRFLIGLTLGLVCFYQLNLSTPVWADETAIAPTTETVAKTTANPKLNSIISRLNHSAPDEFSKQISIAIQNSPVLMDQFNQLASNNQLLDIIVLNTNKTINGPRLKATVIEGRIYITTDLLIKLKNNTPFQPLKKEQFAPDNTAFILAHIGHHLMADDDVFAKDNADALDMAKNADKDGAMDIGGLLERIKRRSMENEAQAYIKSWNAVLSGAVVANNGQDLNSSQLSALRNNLTYRRFFLELKKGTSETLRYETSGMLIPTPDNIRIFADGLTAMKRPNYL